MMVSIYYLIVSWIMQQEMDTNRQKKRKEKSPAFAKIEKWNQKLKMKKLKK